MLSGNIFLRRLRLWSNFSDSKSSRRFSLFSPELAGSDRSAVETSTLSWAGTEARKHRRREKFILGVERRRGLVVTGGAHLMVLTDTSSPGAQWSSVELSGAGHRSGHLPPCHASQPSHVTLSSDSLQCRVTREHS